MIGWRCPECKRVFRRQGQSHECAPAMTLDEYFSTGPERERPIFEAVMKHLAKCPDIHVEPVSVGIFLKHGRTFAQLRPMRDWVALSMSLSHKIDHPCIRRKVQSYNGRYYHVFNLRGPEDIDDTIRECLTEAYTDSNR